MDGLFDAREKEIKRLKAETMENVDRHCSKSEVFQRLKNVMVEVMEQDVKLWQQLTTLQNTINSLKNELIETRCRTNTRFSDAESDQGLGEDDNNSKIPINLRSHTVTLAEEIRVFTTHSLLFVERLNVSLTKELCAVGEMRDTNVKFIDYNRRSGFLGMFSPCHYKTGLFETDLSGLNNNIFLAGLNARLLDLVGDIIKAPSSQQILPRRRLHSQSNVYDLVRRDVKAAGHKAKTPADDHNLELRSTLEKMVSVDANGTCEGQVDKQKSTKTYETGKRPKCDIRDRSRSTDNNVNEITDSSRDGPFNTELEHTDKDIVDEYSDRETPYQTEIPQGEDDPELTDMTFTYLILNDGYVTCRIMTPSLEQQTKLKHETEDEPLEYLTYSCGFVRFRSDSDSECSSWSENEQSDIDSSSLGYFNNAEIHSDVYCDIKYLFRTYIGQEGSESDQSDTDSNILECFADEETEPDVLNDIKYLFGSDRQRYFSESDHSDANCESLERLTDEESRVDAYCYIKYLFGTDGKQYCSKSSDDDVQEGREKYASTLPKGILDAQVMASSPVERFSEDLNTKDFHVQRDTIDIECTANRLNKQFVAADEIINQMIGDARSVVSQEYIVNGCGLCVYTEKHCSFTYRISSVDSGIGEDINEILDVSD